MAASVPLANLAEAADRGALTRARRRLLDCEAHSLLGLLLLRQPLTTGRLALRLPRRPSLLHTSYASPLRGQRRGVCRCRIRCRRCPLVGLCLRRPLRCLDAPPNRANAIDGCRLLGRRLPQRRLRLHDLCFLLHPSQLSRRARDESGVEVGGTRKDQACGEGVGRRWRRVQSHTQRVLGLAPGLKLLLEPTHRRPTRCEQRCVHAC